jgi:hypothetical protein
MKSRFGLAVTAIAFGVALATPSLAQEVGTKPVGVSLRAGVFFPSSSEAKDGGGNTWFGVGLDYKLGNLRFGGMNEGYSASWGISLDYYGKGDFRNVPVLVNYVGRADQFFYSAGAGLGFARAVTAPGRITSSTEFSYQLSVGYDFLRGSTPLFLEARYHGSAESRLNGYAINLGVRF